MILFIETRRDVYTAEMWHFVLSWQYRFTSDSLSVSILMAIFSGGPWLAGNVSILDFIGTEGDGGDGENWSCKTCKAPVKVTLSTNQCPTFYRPDALALTESTKYRIDSPKLLISLFH